MRLKAIQRNARWSLVGAFGVLGLFLATAGCSRSSAYKQDQSYFKDENSYYNRKGAATARAERFGQPKKKLHVLAFYNSTPLGGDEFGDFAAMELLREVKGSGRAVVPEDLRSEDASKDFYAGNKVRLGALVREGKKLGVALIVIGRVKKITYRTKGDEVGLFRKKAAVAAVDAEMRVYDVINGKEVLFDEKSADSSSSQVNLFGGDSEDPRAERLELVRMALRNVSRIFAQDLSRAIDKLNWEGRIAKVLGVKVYVNAGRASGLNIGDILKVLTTGEDVYDPVTGAYMGRATGQPKGTLEIVDYLGHDGSVAVVHSGGNFSENDIVQLY